MLSCLLAVSAFAVGCDDEVAHTHSFAKDWTTSETEHWHVASCEHNTEVSDKANHVDADKDGDCDVCAYEIGTKGYVNEAVAKAVAKASTINGAKIAIDSDADYSAIEYYDYVVGENAVKLTVSSVAFDDDKSSHAYDTVLIYSDFDGETFGAVETSYEDGDDTVYEYSRLSSVQAGANKGVALAGSELYLEDDFVTTEAVLAKLWEIASANANGACEYAVDGDVYSFNADYIEYDGTYYISANVEFTLANDGSLATAVVELEGYYAEDVAENEDAEAPAVLNKYALADFHKYFIIEQTAGEKTYTAPEDATDKMLIEDFAIAYAEMSSDPYSPPTNYGFVTDTALAMKVSQTEMMFAFYADNTANIMEDMPMDMSNEVVTIEVAGDYDVDYEYDEGTLSIIVNEPTVGTDKIAVTVSTEKASKTIYLTATRPVIESLSVKNSKDNIVSSVNGFAGLEYTFSAVAMPTGAEPAYSVACNVTEGVTLTDNGDGTWTFKATTAGDYELTFTSVAKNASDEDVTAKVDITLAELPDVSTLLNKANAYVESNSGATVAISYTDDWKVGTFTISNYEMMDANYQPHILTIVLDYVYNESTGEIETTVNTSATDADFFEYNQVEMQRWGEHMGWQITTLSIGFNDTMTALSLVKTVKYDYEDSFGYSDQEMVDAYDLTVMTVYDQIASTWANSEYNWSDANDNWLGTYGGYVAFDTDNTTPLASIKLNADQTGIITIPAVQGDGTVKNVFIAFSYSVDGTAVSFTNVRCTLNASYFVANSFVTVDGGTYTIATTTINSDFTTVTIAGVAFNLV